MKLRRCAVLYLEPREQLEIDWSALFAGTSTLAASLSWQALAPHLDQEIEIDSTQLLALGGISQTVWSEYADCAQRWGADVIDALLAQGLLLSDAPQHAAPRARDDTLRALHWRPLSALAHTFSRWHDVRADTGMSAPTFQQLLDRYGPPPPPTAQPSGCGAALALPAVAPGALDGPLLQRYTGRNFDRSASLPLALVARLLQRSFGAQEQRTIGPHAHVLKKTSPSGGSLHPIDAYVLVQRVEGVAPGLYHYHPLQHTLQPLRLLDADAAAALALHMMADQHWLADAPLQVVLVARMARSYWKYRNHHKAYKVLALDAGHLSQTFYLLAAEAGLPAFITAAVNDAVVEQALELDHLQHAVMAVCGCGVAASGARSMVELRYGETGAI
ncbi:MAG: putative peptide maturation dehydrogenase [Sphingomonadaceae bacterium]